MKYFLVYLLLILCDQVYACTHTCRITDTFGDGWNGGVIKIQVNGVDVLTNIGPTLPGAGPLDFTFSANAGDVIAVIQTTAGSWPSEMRAQILDCGGNSLLGPIQPVSGAGTTVAGVCGTSMSISSATVSQSSTSSLTNCSTNSQIVRLEITASGSCSALTVTQIQTNFSGTAAAGNVSSAKIYYTGTSTTFSTGTLFGSGTASTSTYNINGSQALVAGTNYFWLTYTLYIE